MKRNTSETTEVATPAYINRVTSWRNGKPVVRTQISSPMALISTSNVHVQTAHAIAGTVPIEIRKISKSSSIDSATSGDDSDGSLSSSLSNGTITDASSVDDSPIAPTPELNRLSYCKPTLVVVNRSSHHSAADLIDLDITPKIPQRSPSRSTSAYVVAQRKRSLQQAFAPTIQVDIPRASLNMTTVVPRASIKNSFPPSTHHASNNSARRFIRHHRATIENNSTSNDNIADHNHRITTGKSIR